MTPTGDARSERFRRPFRWLAGSALLLLVVGWTLRALRTAPAAAPAAGSAPVAATGADLAGTQTADVPRHTQGQAAAGAAGAAPTRVATLVERIHRSRREWDRMAERIRVARSERLAAEESGPAPVMAPGSLDKAYIQARVQEVVPLVRECYELALEVQPQLAGRVVLAFSLTGEPEIGGIVESSEIVERDDGISSPVFDECLQETIYALTFDPPEGGGTVKVTYPFNFQQNADEAAPADE